MGTGARRSDYQDRLTESRALRDSLMGNYTAWRDQRGNAQNESNLFGMLADPSKRGMSDLELRNAQGQSAEALTGARRSTLEDINRRTAASGMGSTGLGMRTALEYGKDYARQQAESNRSVTLANEQMKRDDLWKATAAEMEREQMQGDMMTRAYGLYGNLIGMDYTGLAEKHQPGFWGRFGNAFADFAGSGLGKLLTGG